MLPKNDVQPPAFPDLSCKTIWITGGAGHLGTPVTRTLDQQCKKVVCFDLPGRGEQLISNHCLQRTEAISGDICEAENLNALLEKAFEDYGVPDGLVHLAFVSSSGKYLHELSPDDLNRTFMGSLTTSFLLCRTVAERMKSNGGGSIVLFSSMYGIVSPDPRIYRDTAKPNPIDYGMSKAGILQMMRYLAVYYGKQNIRVNCVTPGAFPNPTAQAANPELTILQQEKIPLNRVGQEEEIVGPTLFLLSKSASYVTGHSLVVDGGWTAW